MTWHVRLLAAATGTACMCCFAFTPGLRLVRVTGCLAPLLVWQGGASLHMNLWSSTPAALQLKGPSNTILLQGKHPILFHPSAICTSLCPACLFDHP